MEIGARQGKWIVGLAREQRGFFVRLLLATAICGFAVLAAPPAESAPKKGADSKSENGSKKKSEKSETSKVPEVPGGDIFGITSPTDVGDKGDYGIANEFDGRLQKRDGSYRAFGNKTELGYTFADNWWMGASVVFSSFHIRGVPDLDDLSKTDFDGLSFKLIHRMIERSATNPFALSFSAEPRWARLDGLSGLRSTAYALELKAMSDAVVVPDKLFWAANVTWIPIRGQDVADRSVWLDQSAAFASMALTAKINDKLFVGAEIRYIAAYNTTWFEERVGQALYFGPTVLWNITDKIAVNATWQPQIAGKSPFTPDLRYDLTVFDRSQFRIKLAVALN